MTGDFVAERSVTISAPADAVWQALTDPDKVKVYMHGANMATDWKVGSPIVWTGEWKGKPYEDKCKVLAFEPGKLLKITHWSPMGGSAHSPENYHTVTYTLAEQGDKTVLALAQDHNATQDAADQMAANNWGPVLEGIKAIAEH